MVMKDLYKMILIWIGIVFGGGIGCMLVVQLSGSPVWREFVIEYWPLAYVLLILVVCTYTILHRIQKLADKLEELGGK